MVELSAPFDVAHTPTSAPVNPQLTTSPETSATSPTFELPDGPTPNTKCVLLKAAICMVSGVSLRWIEAGMVKADVVGGSVVKRRCGMGADEEFKDDGRSVRDNRAW